MRKTDYLIIGAGIVGCSAAYLLTKDGKKVTIGDKSYPCNEASGVNAGGMELLQQPPKSLPMHVLAAQLWDILGKDHVFSSVVDSVKGERIKTTPDCRR